MKNKYLIIISLLYLSACAKEYIEISPFLTGNIPITISGSISELCKQGFRYEDAFWGESPSFVYKDFSDSLCTYDLLANIENHFFDELIESSLLTARYKTPQNPDENPREVLLKIRATMEKEDFYLNYNDSNTTKLNEWNTVHGWYLNKKSYVVELLFDYEKNSNLHREVTGYRIHVHRALKKIRSIENKCKSYESRYIR